MFIIIIIIKKPVQVSAGKHLLCLPQLPEEKHRLAKLRLIISEISGVASECQDFRTQLLQSCAPRGDLGLGRDTPDTYKGGVGMRTEGVLIQFHRLEVNLSISWRHFWTQDLAIMPSVLQGQLCRHLSLCSRMEFLSVSKNW